MIELTKELKNTAQYSPVAVAEDGKRFVFLCDAFYSSYDIGVYDKTEVYKARAFCPDDTPDEDGDLSTYDIYFEVINWGGEDEADRCDWESVYDYCERDDYISKQDADVLTELACRTYSEQE